MMQLKERLIEEIKTLPPNLIVNIYDMVMDMKKKKSLPVKESSPAYLRIQKVLTKCSGSLSDDIRLSREDRI